MRVESTSNFRGTLVDGVLQPGIRLGNALTLRLSKQTDVERDAEAEWQREHTHISFGDFASAIILDPLLDSSLGLVFRRGSDPLQLIEGSLSLSERESDFKQQEAKLNRHMGSIFGQVKV